MTMLSESQIRQSLSIHTVEEFLTTEELTEARSVIATSEFGEGEPSGRGLTESIHALYGKSKKESALLYSPKGRLERQQISATLSTICDTAFDRNLENIRCVFPSVESHSNWILVGYRSGQYIVPHVDLSDQNESDEVKVATMTVNIICEATGGAFFIETSRDNAEWRGGGPAWSTSPGEFNPTFRQRKATRWKCNAESGTALIFGCHLSHGTEPVNTGVVVKALTFLYGRP